ncbi:MAG: histidinol phosphatase [Clostridia bacterium]|nr:histidinol phosphatase [Clostridia bacterium]
MGYLYELHCHTSETSRCSRIDGAALAEFYKKNGYDGVVITDHFFNGNTTVAREGEWKDRVDAFLKGYENAKKRGDEIGIKIFFAWEYSYRGTDFLTYGPSPEWLYAHPEVMNMNTNEYCRFIRENGWYIFHAHPFREAGYIDMIRLIPRDVDGVETYNACRTDFENAMADQYADNYSLLKIAGSDNHVGPLKTLGAMEFEKPMESLLDIIEAVKIGEGKFAYIKPVE